MQAQPVHWRCADNPRPGSIYRLPDIPSIQRGITYTYLPDGRAIQVPAMNKLIVNATAESHQEDENKNIVEALKNLVIGKAPSAGKARFDHIGRAHVPLSRRMDSLIPRPKRGPPVRNEIHGDGLRGLPIEA